MRPGHLRVFDGLRLTTEHIEHMQSACHMALRDLRRAVGLGRIHSGFGVVRSGPNTLTVHPGFAFDQEGNQIVNDEPKTVEFQFGPSQEKLFLCIRYDQVSTDEVEGKPVQFWDSCSIIIRPDLPSNGENQIPIAALEKLPGNNGDSPRLSSLRNGVHPRESSLDRPGTKSIVTGSLQVSREVDTTELIRTLREDMRLPSADPSRLNTVCLLGDPVIPAPFKQAQLSLHVIANCKLLFPFAPSTTAGLSTIPPGADEIDISLQITAQAEVAVSELPLQRSVESSQVVAHSPTRERLYNAAKMHEGEIVNTTFEQIRNAGECLDENLQLSLLNNLSLRVAIESGGDSLLRLNCAIIANTQRATSSLEMTQPKTFVCNVYALWKAVKL